MKKLLSLILCAGMILSLLVGCGGKAAGAQQLNASYSMDSGSISEADIPLSANNASTPQAPSNRKWIVTVDLTAEVGLLESAMEDVLERVAALDGYVENQSIDGSSSRKSRWANLTVRVPADQVDAFTSEISENTNVVSMRKSLEDVTLSYSSTANRVAALETEETRLLELLSQAENMADLLEIESRLTDVRYELEDYASRLRLYDNQIDYATIYLRLHQVEEYTPTEDPTVWQRIQDGFRSSLAGLGASLVDLVVFLIAASPFLVVYGAILALIIFLVRKNRANRKAKKAAQRTQQASQNPDVQPQ